MAPRRPVRRRVGAWWRMVVAVALLASACSGDDGGGGTAATTTSTSSTTTSATTPTAAAAPPGPPGRLLGAAPVAPPPGAPPGTLAWDVTYASRSVDDAPTVVSGRVFSPPGPPPLGGRPVLAWAHGTTGSADVCTPGRLGHVPPSLGPLLAAGWVVAATDYEGLGTPGPHPYLVGASEGNAVLDAARAAADLPGAGAGRRVAAYGHSQGGHAVLFAGQRAAAHAPDVDLVAVVAAAPAADPATLLSGVVASPVGLGLLVTAVDAWAEVYDDLAASDVLTPAAVADLGLLDERCIDGVTAAFLRPVAGVVATDPRDLPAWERRAAENTPDGTGLRAPVLVVQGDRDPLVPPSATVAAVARLCAGGAAVDLRRYPDADHGGVLAAAEPDVLAFLARALEGGAAGATGCRGPS